MSDRPDNSPVTAALAAAFEALAKYDRGSGRGALQPIDDVVAAALRDDTLRTDLETRLVAVLRGKAAAVAKEYACGKLAMIGGPVSVAALAASVPVERLAHAATNALQVMPCAEAGAALRAILSKLAGMPLAGALTALGIRREGASVGAVASYLTHATPAVACAAAGALGEIATPVAAAALREFLPEVPSGVKAAAADAALVCAGRLKSEGDIAAAKALLESLLATEPTSHIRAAAARLNA